MLNAFFTSHRNLKRNTLSLFPHYLLFKICIFTLLTNTGCLYKNDRLHHKINQPDSVKYYKDVEWLNFKGMGKKYSEPLNGYPFTEFAYFKDTISVTAFLSPNNKKTIALIQYDNHLKYFVDSSTEELGTRKKVFRYTFLNTDEERLIKFNMYKELQKDSANLLNDLSYVTKTGNEYKSTSYSIRNSSGWLYLKDILSADTTIIDRHFCHKFAWIEKISGSKIYMRDIENLELCSEINFNVLDTSISMTNLDLPYFYHKMKLE